MRVISFGSGSSGNALLVQSGSTALLIDCGLSRRQIERQLMLAGLEPAALSAILLTHEHGDHALSVGSLARRFGVPVLATAPTLLALGPVLEGVSSRALIPGCPCQVGGCMIEGFLVPHDAAEPVGYTLRMDDGCVGVAIDLGSWDERVLAALEPADLVIIEANHDRERLRVAPYSWPVKQRIFGPHGHLDNIAAGELLARLGQDGRPRTAWLAHLSEQANSPALARRMVMEVLDLACVKRITVAALPRTRAMHWQSDQQFQQQELLFGL